MKWFRRLQRSAAISVEQSRVREQGQAVNERPRCVSRRLSIVVRHDHGKGQGEDDESHAKDKQSQLEIRRPASASPA